MTEQGKREEERRKVKAGGGKSVGIELLIFHF